jgi:hypothetical protein
MNNNYNPFGEEDTAEKIEDPLIQNWRQAYEKNKTRDNCILCGAPTQETELLSSTIRYCPCVDVLACYESEY